MFLRVCACDQTRHCLHCSTMRYVPKLHVLAQIYFCIVKGGRSIIIGHHVQQIKISLSCAVSWFSCTQYIESIRESPPQLENRIVAPVYVRSITRTTMYYVAEMAETVPIDIELQTPKT